MDSLLANYASSDEEGGEESLQQQKHKPPISKPLKNSTEIHSRKLRNHDGDDGDDGDFLSVGNKRSPVFSLPPPKLSSSSLLSSLPAPKASKSNPFNIPIPIASSEPKQKKVVQFRPPVISSNSVDDDDEDEDEKAKRRKRSESDMETRSVTSFLSSLPAPKSSGTLGALPLGSGTGRRSIVEADVPASDCLGSNVGNEVGVNSNVGYYDGQSVHGSTVSSSGAVDGGYQSEYMDPAGGEGGYPQWGTQGENYTNYQGYTGYGNGDGDGDGEYSNWVGPAGEQHSNYASGYGSYSDYGQSEHNLVDGSNASAQELPESAESALRLTGKRGRKDNPPQIVEVKQDELIKNRPREDQAKMTGIAFGPSYQPTSTKGKPPKLHKRKHQIGSLYFDMRQKEMELAERRSRGMLTKAQTQGKYGW